MYFFASDVHWQGAAENPTGAFGDFLDHLANRTRAGEPCALWILGDLFDFWWERGEHILPFYQPHVAALRRATEAGVRISLLFGNRDFTLGAALPELCGVEIAGDRVEVTVGERRVLLQHGDLLCTGDRRYQRYRRVIRSRPAQALMRLVPMSRVESIVERMRHTSRAEIARKPADSMGVVDSAVAGELARGFDAVICGHVHRPEQRRIGESGELIVLGPWGPDHGWYASSDGGEIGLHRFPN